MLKLPIFGSIRHMKRIGDDPAHRALRYRNEQRLAALKASNRLYEDKRESVTSGNCAAPASAIANSDYQRALNNYYNQAAIGTDWAGHYGPYTLGSILGLDVFNHW